MVQHIQSPHARDEIKWIKYATYFRDGHAPAPNYTSHTEGQRVEEVEVATAVADMAVAVAARLAVAIIYNTGGGGDRCNGGDDSGNGGGGGGDGSLTWRMGTTPLCCPRARRAPRARPAHADYVGSAV